MTGFGGGDRWVKDEGGNVRRYPDQDELNSGLVGVWKTFAENASNAPMACTGGSITLGNGVLWGRWWTPGPVELDPDNDTPFLCIIEAFFKLGSSSSFTGKPHLTLPEAIDGEQYALVIADDADYPFVVGQAEAFAHIDALGGSKRAFGVGAGVTGVIIGTDAAAGAATYWDPETPGEWAEDDTLYLRSTFRAKLQYTGD